MGKWIETTIAEIADVYDGPHATPTKTDNGPWFLSISSLDRGRLNLSESAHLSEEDFAKWTRRVTPQAGDVLFSYETRLGEAALMPDNLKACLGRRMGLLRPKPDRVDPRFLLYSYLAPKFQCAIVERRIHGATVDRIPLVDLPSWPISIPLLLAEQRAIAAVLGALDDKIALNEKTADCSHKLAALRYDEAIRDRHNVPLSSLVEPILGGTPDRQVSEYWRPGVPWASARDVAACQFGTLLDTAETITEAAAEGKRFKPVPPGSVLLTARGTVGAVARVCQNTSLNQSCYAMLPNKLPPAVLYLTVRSAAEQMLSVAHGTVFSTLNMKSFNHLHAPILSSRELATLENATGPLLDHVELRLRENRALAQLRDTLLPKLMSSELRVRDAERIAEDVL